MHEIALEMCALLEQQSQLLKSGNTISAMSAAELDGYTSRNQRLRQLLQQLNELTL